MIAVDGSPGSAQILNSTRHTDFVDKSLHRVNITDAIFLILKPNKLVSIVFIQGKVARDDIISQIINPRRLYDKTVAFELPLVTRLPISVSGF